MRSSTLFLIAAGFSPYFSATFAFQQASPATEQRAMLDKYCVTCHNQRLKTGGLTLDNLNLDKVADNAETWEKVLRKLHGGMMPPQGMPRPDDATVTKFTEWLETSIDRAAATHPEPGRSTLHRLNRTEYGNAIHDLLDLDIDATSFLPADDEANGFDNIADVLRFSPSLLEQYLSASDKIASLAVGDPSITPVSLVYHAAPDLDQEQHIEGLPLGTRGGILIHYNFPLDGEYDFRVFPAAEHRRLPDGPRVRAPARNQHRRPARVSGAGRRRGRQQDVGRQPGRRQGHHRRAVADAHPGQGRASDRGGDVPAPQLRAIRRAAAAVHPRPRFAEHERRFR